MSWPRTPSSSSNCSKYAITPNYRSRHTTCLRRMVDLKCRCNIRRGQGRSLWNAIFQESQPALFAITGGECKAPVLDKLQNDHSYHVFARQESEQLSSEAMGPDCVINRCQIYKHGTGLSFYFKTALNVLGHQNCLI